MKNEVLTLSFFISHFSFLIYLDSWLFLKKNLYTSLSVSEGNSLFIKMVLLPLKVRTSVRLRCSMAFRISFEHSSAVIRLASSSGDSPWGLPCSFNATLRILEAVKPGQTHITCTPVCNNSVRMASSQPCNANLEAE